MTAAKKDKPRCARSDDQRQRCALWRGGIHLLITLITSILPVAQTKADGCFVSGKFEDLHAPQQSVAIVWDGQREVMVLATRVRASDLTDFGWIIPVETKSKPAVELGDSRIFNLLKDYFKDIPDVSWGLSERKVEVVETKDVGIYKVTIVKATEAEAFSTWLRAHGFKSSQALEEMLSSYALEDFFFVLAKIDLTLQYRADIDFVRRQEYVADVQSLDGKAIKALASLRWPTGGPSLAELVAEDIVAQKPYQLSHLASHPLKGELDLLTPEAYQRLLKQYADATEEEKGVLTEELSDTFFSNDNIQHFVRIENVYKDLEAGVANPLRISFSPARPFFPMRISSVNQGKVAVVAYVFADEPLRDGSEILQATAWKPVGDDIREQISNDLDIAGRTCLTKLTFSGRSTAFVKDVYFEPMTGEQRSQLLEDRQIVGPRLYGALRMHDVNAVRHLLREHPNTSELFDNAGVLKQAITKGRFSRPWDSSRQEDGAAVEMVRLFLEHGFDVNARDKAGRAALHHLASEGARHADLARTTQLLLHAGAQVNLKDNEGKTALHVLASEGASKFGLVYATQRLSTPGVQANLQDDNGTTARHGHATKEPRHSDFLDATKLLLDAGAQVNLQDDDGKTALHLLVNEVARHSDLMHVMQLLLDAGAQVNLTDSDGKTVLDHIFGSAPKHPRLSPRDAAAPLIRHGAVLRSFDPNDLSKLDGHVAALALTAAVESGNKELIDSFAKGRPVRSVDTVCNEAWEILRQGGIKPHLYQNAFDELRIARLYAPSDCLVLSLLGIAQYRCGDPNALNTLKRARIVRATQASEKSAGSAVISDGGKSEPSLAARLADLAAALEIELSLQDDDRVVNESTLAGSPVLQSMLSSLRARDPEPADGTEAVAPSWFNWVSGNMALRHNVYFGTDPNVGPGDLVALRIPVPMHSPDLELTPGQTYYWRVDEVTETGRVVTGDVWTFTPECEKPRDTGGGSTPITKPSSRAGTRPRQIAASPVSTSARPTYGGGSGTADDPYRIATAADLIALGETPGDYDKHFVLTADIDLDPSLPGRRVFDAAVIAPDADPAEGLFQGPPFAGTFDGGDHVISNLTITGKRYVGLFGQLSPEAHVKDLGVVDVNIASTEHSAGGLAGGSSPYNIASPKPSRSGERGAPGGRNRSVTGGAVTNCYSTGAVSGNKWVGGLVGGNGGPLTRCRSAAAVDGNDHSAGGLAGYNSGEIADCNSSGSVNGKRSVGGLVGDNFGQVTHCHSSGSVSGEDGVGGLAGYNWGVVTGCHSSGAVNGRNAVGGLVGLSHDPMATISPSRSRGRISNSHATGSVTGTGRGVGGLVGDNFCAITSCYSTGLVQGERYVGGLVGSNRGDVACCRSTGHVTGIKAVGGLLGSNAFAGEAMRCYSTGAVSGTDDAVGGLVGEHSGCLSHCYSIGRVKGGRLVDTSGKTVRVGGLVGYQPNRRSVVLSCFWDTDSSGLTASDGGQGLTTLQMQDARTFLNAGWDFVEEIANGATQVWQMPEGGGYPVLAILNGFAEPALRGAGTPDDPYLISDALELGAIEYCSPSAYHRLVASIDLSGIRWPMPVVRRFAGTFDGDGHTISNLTINAPNSAGFFGTLQRGASVVDLGIVGANVMGSSCVGGLAGSNGGSVTRCWVAGTVRGRDPRSHAVGGLAGENYEGTLTSCYSTGMVTGGSNIGGLVGKNERGTLMSCYSTSQVDGSSAVGGLVGDNRWGTLSKSYSAGAVNGSGGGVGGLVGSSTGRVLASFWDMESSGMRASSGGAGLTTTEMMNPRVVALNGLGSDPNWVMEPSGDYPRLVWQGKAGLRITVEPSSRCEWLKGTGAAKDPYRIEAAGQLISLAKASNLWDGHFLLCADIDLDPNLPGNRVFDQAVIPSFTGSFDGGGHRICNLSITGQSHLGLFGRLEREARIKGLHLDHVNIVGTGPRVGGLAGTNSRGTISTSSCTGSVSGADAVGGLVGSNSHGDISACRTAGSVDGTKAVGGLVGHNSYGTVATSCSTASVKGQSSVGGLVGENAWSKISTSHATGSVRGTGNVGGLLGRNWQGTVSDSYSRASVDGPGKSFRAVGGLVGDNHGSVIRSYSTGTVKGENDTRIGGLSGDIDGRATSSFWDTQTSGRTWSAGGLGKTTPEMQTVSTFLDAGWDFVDEADNGTDDIWWILEGQDYPRLSWELEDEQLAP